MKGAVCPENVSTSASEEKAGSNRKGWRLEAVVLGNGPSLRGFDFGRLARFDVFGMNAAYRYWYEIGWFPQYYSCLDLVVGASHREAIAGLVEDSDRLGIRAFLLRQPLIVELGKLGALPKVFNFDLLRAGFESWITGPVTTGSHTCAWASILGYRDIYLLGVDCNYVEIVNNAELMEDSVLRITSDAPNPNYFFDAYQQKGDTFNIPNPRKDLHLQSWRNVGAKIRAGSRVLNAGHASKVDQFAFVRFDDVERGGRVPIYSPSDVLVDYVQVPSGEMTHQPASSVSETASARQRTANPGLTKKQARSILAYDAEWLSADSTENQALVQAAKLLPEVPGVVYLGFPWATLIDRLTLKQSSAEGLKDVLDAARPLLNQHDTVVTVCQHADMLSFQEIFIDSGITHVFWTHAEKGQDCFPADGRIQILPFPLYPNAALWASSQDASRKHLFSFIEPKSQERLTGKTTRMILDTLAGKQGGLVIPRIRWDFDEVLHGDSIRGENHTEQNLPACAAPIEVGGILRESLFSICPSDSGTNSMRVWESIACGSIPVILADNYLPPGGKDLWELATVSCPERQEDISALPGRLAAMARDQDLLERKRHALRQLRMIYGPDCFIYDIQKLFLSLAGEAADITMGQAKFSYGRLYDLAAEINGAENLERSVADIFILGCSSRVLFDSSGFLNRFAGNIQLRRAYRQALQACSRTYADSMVKALESRRIDVERMSDR